MFLETEVELLLFWINQSHVSFPFKDSFGCWDNIGTEGLIFWDLLYFDSFWHEWNRRKICFGSKKFSEGVNFGNENGCFLLFTILWFRIFEIFFIYLKFYVYRDSCLWGIVEDKILRSTHIIRIMFLMIIFVPSNSYQLQWYNWKRWYMRQIHTTRASGMRSLNEDLFGCSVSFLCFLSSGQNDSIVFFVVFLDEC